VSEASSTATGTLGAVSSKTSSKPVWWKNTYFWIAGILFILGIIGLPFLAGENAIRDPGQKREHGLPYLYFAGAIIMYINGWLSHRQTVQHYKEILEGEDK
jgi:hypothetical protein